MRSPADRTELIYVESWLRATILSEPAWALNGARAA
jgi:hypothetical protein